MSRGCRQRPAESRGARREAWQVRIDKQKAEAAALLATAKDRVDKAESIAAALRQEQNLKDAENVKNTAAFERRLADAGRLRDPKATPARCGGSGAGPGAQGAASAGAGGDNAAEAPGLLSIETSDFLRRLTREADEINLAYISCRADAQMLRELGSQGR